MYIYIYIYIINTWGINPANTLNQASNPTTTNQSWHSYTAPKHLEVQRIEATSVASRVDEIQVVSMHSTKHPLAPPNWPWDGPWPRGRRAASRAKLMERVQGIGFPTLFDGWDREIKDDLYMIPMIHYLYTMKCIIWIVLFDPPHKMQRC